MAFTAMTGDDRLRSVAELFHQVGSFPRLKILVSLLDGEKSVGEIVEIIGKPQATASETLGNLRRAGLVDVRCDGRRHFYSLTPTGRELTELAKRMAG